MLFRSVMVGTNAATYSPYLQNLSWLDENNEEHSGEFSHGEDGGDAAPMMDGTSSNTFSPFLQNLARSNRPFVYREHPLFPGNSSIVIGLI